VKALAATDGHVSPERENVSELNHFVKVDFHNFKAFERFTLHLRHFNILVGPNNSGKSTILAAFRILAASLRKANARKPELVPTPQGRSYGYKIDLKDVSVAEENIFYNYDDTVPALVKFKLSNKSELQLYFPELNSCYLISETQHGQPRTPSAFRKQFNCTIGFVPILGPVEHNEYLYKEEAARLALYNYTAARNFRNIWYHYPERFQEFRRILMETWPGMDIEAPEVVYSSDKTRLYMLCPEERIPREIFWAGFGFQVWCQMLTHLVQSNDKSLFLIDEPDIYLHADLQRQLLSLLRNLGPDILVATHSTEIITEAEADDIVVINKKRKQARRIKHPSELSQVFTTLGSNLNPILTQLAKSRRAVFIEGKDFQIFSKYARKLSYSIVANRSEFAVIPIEGFNPERARSLINGIETTLGGKISTAIILDRDFRSQPECDFIEKKCGDFCDLVRIHSCKEIENFLLIPQVIDRAANLRVEERVKRGGKRQIYISSAQEILNKFAEEKKTYVTSQFLAFRRRFQRSECPSMEEASANEETLDEFEKRWTAEKRNFMMIPGKDALSRFNEQVQKKYGITVTATAIINSIKATEIPPEMVSLIESLDEFTKKQP
jgi:energy-coupling factor transporter ATP-binding protein EcfA2